VLSGLILSALCAALLGPAWIRDMSRAGLVRTNYAGRTVAFPAGAVLIAISLLALAPLAVLDDRADLDLLDPGLRQWLAYILGVALLGLLDDALGRGAAPDSNRGWRGHAAAVLAGRFSTGAIKAVGALALAAYAVSGRGQQGLDYVADLALLLLATNLFNLIDLRPGRVEKAFALLLAGLCLGAWTDAPLELLGIFIGPVIVGAAFTLPERAMLGDTGSNLVGALAGVAMLVTLGDDARLGALAIVLALTIYGEFRSISAAIEGFPPLRWLDSIGRLRQGPPKR
jgi:UDP-N-acetylmuramyl pentapeptide phosphotransferase/UDP-N-acetylglucosamine-1-phosphate transferase